jgi:FlaA1/EpsC-like NDP-sugar epimerase/membrane-associated phospholipid phosphatase
LVCSLVGLLTLAWSVRGQPTAGGIDAVLSRRLQEHLSSREYSLEVLALAGSLYALTIMVMVLALACAWLRWRRALAFVLVAPAAATVCAELVLKPLVHRTRDHALSFPSGTTTGVFSIAAVIGLLLLPRSRVPRWPAAAGAVLAAAAVGLAVSVAVAVVGLGWHYVSDALGGAATALVTVLATALVIDALGTRWSRRSPCVTGHRDAEDEGGGPRGAAGPPSDDAPGPRGSAADSIELHCVAGFGCPATGGACDLTDASGFHTVSRDVAAAASPGRERLPAPYQSVIRRLNRRRRLRASATTTEPRSRQEIEMRSQARRIAPSGWWNTVRTDGTLAILDALVVAVAYAVALALRFDGQFPEPYRSRLPVFVLLAAAVHVVSLAATGCYARVWRQAGLRDAWQLGIAAFGSTCVLVLVVVSGTDGRHVLPLSVPVNAGLLLLLLTAGVRFRWRLLSGLVQRHGTGGRLVLVGDVDCARHVIEQMQRSGGAAWQPVALVTDEAGAWRRNLRGVPVTGPVDRLGEVAEQHSAEHVLLVLGDDAGEEVRHVVDLATEAGLLAKILPTVRETLGRRPGLHDIRDLSLEDLLGREQVPVDEEALRATITDRRVLITGAGGSIGREIAAQAAALDPALLVLLDHDETHLHDAVAGLSGNIRCVLGDIREEPFIQRLFQDVCPEVVFHAAAHKHVPILEHFPSEAVRTNVFGTDVVVRAALAVGTQRFVAISTDKAVEPTSVMGASKRLAEQLLVHRLPGGMRYCAVRFGNVLGSRGSVVPTFMRQLQQGVPLTVTHPDVTRFFMSVTEAVELVMEAATLAEGGEVFMLDMGEPVRIVDLAERLISLSGRANEPNAGIRFTGLRPGEKLSEQLHSDTETVSPTRHPKIHLVRGTLCNREVFMAGLAHLRELAARRDETRVRTLLLELAGMPAELALDGEILEALRAQPHILGASLAQGSS